MAGPVQQIPQVASDEPYFSDSDPDDEELQDDADVERWLATESAVNRWSRFPAEPARCNLDGPQNNPKLLALGNTDVPVIDEVTAWIKRNNELPADRGPFKPKGRKSRPEDAEANCEAAVKALDLDIPLWGDKDREFYDRWNDTLDYRWNYDFADLRLRRAKKGWKWRLVRIRPNGEVWVQPFIKPSQKPFNERGVNGSQAFEPKLSAAEHLKNIAKQAQWRWRGMPLTKGEEDDDEKRLKHMIMVEALKNHYGFVGEMLTQSSAEMGSSVYVLVGVCLVIYVILFVFGPPSAIPYLSEFLVALLPLQSSLKGIVAMAADMKRKPGDKYTEGGNVRQWLLYWVVYQLLGMVQGWVAIVRPGWFRVVCGWRTVVLALCASPYFGSFAFHPEERKQQRRRLMKIIWQERGQRLADDAILREIPKPSSRFAASGSGPAKGGSMNMVRFDPLWYAKKLEVEARQYLGWHQEYYKGGFDTSSKKLSRARAPSSSLRKDIVTLGRYIAELEQHGSKRTANPDYQMQDPKGFEKCCRDIENAISKENMHARTNQGTQGFKWLIQDQYGATEEDANKFLDALFYEQGVKAAAHSGMRKAIQYDGHGEFRSIWDPYHEAKNATTPFWDPKYVPLRKPNMPVDLTDHEEYKRFLKGDEAVRQKYARPEFQAKWKSALQQRNRPEIQQNLPWTAGYVQDYQENEDVLGLVKAEKLVPGSGLEQRPGKMGRWTPAFLYKASE